MAKSKRFVFITDSHSGHKVGLTPPAFDARPHPDHRELALYRFRREAWDFYAQALAELQPITVLGVGGDMLTGSEGKSNGELLTDDLGEQADMAEACIRLAKAKRIVYVPGTWYHGGGQSDWEAYIAEQVGAEFADQIFLDTNGIIFDLKHHEGQSQSPQGRATALLVSHQWNIRQVVEEHAPRANVQLRGHVHYHQYEGDPHHLAMTCPALQGKGTKYGRRMKGIVHFGLVYFDITDKGELTWGRYIKEPKVSEWRVVKA